MVALSKKGQSQISIKLRLRLAKLDNVYCDGCGFQYQPVVLGALLPHMQNPKWPSGGPKIASIPNFTFLGCLEVPDYYYPGWGWVGVESIRIKALLSSTGLELELSLAKRN